MKMQNENKKPAAGNAKVARYAMKGGSYSLIISVIVLAIVVAVNIFASVLPSSLTNFDISSTNLYSITSNTKAVVNALEKDVTVYWIVQDDEEDDVIENLLSKYESLSDHITVDKKNPDTYPTFAAQYTDEEVSNNSLIVECGDKSRFISYSDIYLTDVDYTTYSYVYSFDGEGALTSAIDYVVSDDLPKLYLLEGHGEAELSEEFSDQIEKENMELETLSLLTVDEIPEDADCLMIYAPSTDISEDEKDMLSSYVEEGGKLLVFAGPTEDGTLTTLYSFLEDYGVTAAEGIVVEGDRNYYASQYPFVCLPDLASDSITDSLIEEGYYVNVPIATGLIVDSSSYVTTLMTTSEEAFSKAAGYEMETYEKEEDDVDGPFALAVSGETEAGGAFVWIGSSTFLDEYYNAFSSGGNLDLAMNSLSYLIGSSEAMAIRTKSLGYNYLTITESSAFMLKAVMIFILPILFIGAGVIVTVTRRRKRHEHI